MWWLTVSNSETTLIRPWIKRRWLTRPFSLASSLPKANYVAETMELDQESPATPVLVVAGPSLDAHESEDWFEAALATCSPVWRPVRNSWGEDEEAEEEVTEEEEDGDDEEQDPFEDFDEDDFDDEFDDDFEEELEDEYEIEPADDGMLEGHPDAAGSSDDDDDGDDSPSELAEEE